mgnify:CR=1 FL=1
MAKEKKSRVNINNKRASFDYEFLETYTAGIVLVGTEIKSIRAGRASMSDAFCFFEKGQLYVRGINIALYAWGSWGQHAPLRDRKLLLQKRELIHLQQKVKEKGLTIVAVRLFMAENGYAKLNIALARGKKQYDKRQSIKEKDLRRERGVGGTVVRFSSLERVVASAFWRTGHLGGYFNLPERAPRRDGATLRFITGHTSIDYK